MGKHIYVHNPFCAGKCPYCDFYSVAEPSLIEDYYDCAAREVKLWAKQLENSEMFSDDCEGAGCSVYFGGGTPSYPDATYIVNLMKTIVREFKIPEDSENTIEINPSSITGEKAGLYRDAGFNRASVGIQSLDDGILKTLGRRHDSGTATEAVAILQDAGFRNISADLIIGVPGQTTDGIIRDIELFEHMGIKHISTYSLTIEEGTPFYKKYRHLEDVMPPETEREMYHKSRDFLAATGFVPYEISNSALPGYQSRHNSSCWRGEEYAAIGAGAHGYLDSVRFGHKDDVKDYINVLQDIAASDRIPEGLIYREEVMSIGDKMREYPFLRLRTTEGIDRVEFERRFGMALDEVFPKAIKDNVSRGLLEDCGRYVRLSSSGLDFASLVMEDFL